MSRDGRLARLTRNGWKVFGNLGHTGLTDFTFDHNQQLWVVLQHVRQLE